MIGAISIFTIFSPQIEIRNIIIFQALFHIISPVFLVSTGCIITRHSGTTLFVLDVLFQGVSGSPTFTFFHSFIMYTFLFTYTHIQSSFLFYSIPRYDPFFLSFFFFFLFFVFLFLLPRPLHFFSRDFTHSCPT